MTTPLLDVVRPVATRPRAEFGEVLGAGVTVTVTKTFEPEPEPEPEPEAAPDTAARQPGVVAARPTFTG